ncbi:MAG: hypothetical protein V7K98_02635 [Nostoc sp.]|uniref:hypothetical protein n=1 Tax=Nostoc sp. TaxID=1180 RepID=UPI002FF75D70
MDEVNPSIADVKLKACIVAIYVTGIGHWALGIAYFSLISLISEFKGINSMTHS